MEEENKIDGPLVTCSRCNKVDVRKQIGISPNRKRKYYANAEGRKWKGRKCPDCIKEEHTEYMRKRRGKKDPLWD
jgi:hypothetical protein